MGKLLEAFGEELELFVQQMAWLNTPPSRPKGSEEKEPLPSRAESDKANNIESDIPPCHLIYLIQILTEIGPCLETGFGLAVIPQSEIASWQYNNGINLDVWEIQTLRQLSSVYREQCIKSKDPGCPAPYTKGDIDEQRRQAVADSFQNFLSGQFVG